MKTETFAWGILSALLAAIETLLTPWRYLGGAVFCGLVAIGFWLKGVAVAITETKGGK